MTTPDEVGPTDLAAAQAAPDAGTRLTRRRAGEPAATTYAVTPSPRKFSAVDFGDYSTGSAMPLAHTKCPQIVDILLVGPSNAHVMGIALGFRGFYGASDRHHIGVAG